MPDMLSALLTAVMEALAPSGSLIWPAYHTHDDVRDPLDAPLVADFQLAEPTKGSCCAASIFLGLRLS